MIHYFSDSQIDKVEYDPSDMVMLITFASGESIKLLYVLSETFEHLIQNPNPYDYFESVILQDSSIGRD